MLPFHIALKLACPEGCQVQHEPATACTAAWPGWLRGSGCQAQVPTETQAGPCLAHVGGHDADAPRVAAQLRVPLQEAREQVQRQLGLPCVVQALARAGLLPAWHVEEGEWPKHLQHHKALELGTRCMAQAPRS